MKTTSKQHCTKEVTVLATFKFKKVARICFSVLSSKGDETYSTCFDGSANHGVCTCKGYSHTGHCYHVETLRSRAAEYFESRQPKPVAQPAPHVTEQEREAIAKPKSMAAVPVKYAIAPAPTEQERAWQERAQYGTPAFSLMR